MNDTLIKVRIQAFLYEASAMILTALLGLFTSDTFNALIMEHFGQSVFGGLLVLVISGLAKHYRNVKMDKELGGSGAEKIYI